jgi:hypothetical protein
VLLARRPLDLRRGDRARSARRAGEGAGVDRAAAPDLGSARLPALAFGAHEFQQLVGITDRLVVDSTEWADLPESYTRLAEFFDRTAVSDIAWARTERWRSLLASLWPGIADVRALRVHGTRAQGYLLAGWLRSRLGHALELEVDEHPKLEGIDLDGEPAPFPPGKPPNASDVLSSELELYTRDPVYEAAVRAAA